MFGKSISPRCQIGRVTWLISLPQSAILLPVMPARLCSLLLLCYESLLAPSIHTNLCLLRMMEGLQLADLFRVDHELFLLGSSTAQYQPLLVYWNGLTGACAYVVDGHLWGGGDKGKNGKVGNVSSSPWGSEGKFASTSLSISRFPDRTKKSCG